MNFRLLLPSLFLIALGTPPIASAAVTIYDGGLYSYISGTQGAYSDSNLGPADGAAIATDDGFLRSTTERLSNGSSITGRLEQVRDGSYYDVAEGYAFANFTVDVDTAYSISGSFTNPVEDVYFSVYLYDFNTTSDLYNYSLRNVSDAPFTAIVDESVGNAGNTLFGSASGMLLAGHSYQFAVYAATRSYSQPDGIAEAFGSATIEFSDPDVEIVPEPASIAVWSCLGLGAVGMTWVRRRRGSQE